jgi:hypothetical protein
MINNSRGESMDHSNSDDSVISDAMWRAWCEKGKKQEKAMVRKVKVFSGVIVILFALGGGLYYLAIR